MMDRLFEIGRPAAVVLVLFCAGSAGAAGAAEIMPHRAIYTMTLGQAKSDAGVTGAKGTSPAPPWARYSAQPAW